VFPVLSVKEVAVRVGQEVFVDVDNNELIVGDL
jgi:hypothetical protein